MEFTHVTDRQSYPSLPPEQMEPENRFDYDLWTDYETEVYLCNCPWGTSEVQVGLTSIGGLGKVVKFADDAARDAYFDGLGDKLVFSTPYRGFSQKSFEIGCPFDVAMGYNYLYLEYNPAAILRGYEGVDGHRRIYYFIRDIVYRSPSNTELVLQLDYWTTFINSVNFTWLGVERGHYPLAVMPPERYLTNPLENCGMLLAPDVVGAGGAPQRKTASVVDLRGSDQWALVVSNADLMRTTATDTAISYFYTETSPSLYGCAVPVADLDPLLIAINATVPQYLQTIQGVYILDGDWFARSSGFFLVGEVQVWNVRPKGGYYMPGATFNKSAFPVSYTKYANLSKLYTYPYSWVEVTDFRGNVTELRIEQTGGFVDIEATLSIAAPFVQLTATMLGVGGGQRQTLTVKSIAQSSYITDGQSDVLQWSWDIPCYQVQQSPEDYYHARNDYARTQRALEISTAHDNATGTAQTAYDNAVASADTAKSNADAAALQAETNANRSAGASKTNTNNINEATKKNNEDMRTYSSLAVTNSQFTTNELNTLNEDYQRAAYQRQIGWVQASTTLQDMFAAASANLGAAQSAVQGVLGGALQGAIAGGSVGAVGAATGAVGGSIGSAVGAAVNSQFVDQTNALMFASDADLLRIEEGYISGNGEAAIKLMKDLTTKRNALQNIELTNNNLLNKTQTERSIKASDDAAEATRKAVEDNSRETKEKAQAANLATHTTATGNAEDTYNNAVAVADALRDLGTAGLAAQLNQARIDAPPSFGRYSGEGANAATRPTGLQIAVCSQSAGDLAAAGEAFLRYGVYLNQWVELKNWQLLDKFTYWKCFDMLTDTTELPDAFVDRLKGLLLGGISVYANPDDIITATPYNNGL